MDPLAFSVGGLLYTPANDAHIAHHILEDSWPSLTSVCLCLEDAIRDQALGQAERCLRDTLNVLSAAESPLPLMFVRVKSPEHLAHVHALLGPAGDVLTGYVFPKFDLSNAGDYMDTLARISEGRARPLYAMPILESLPIARASTRMDCLSALREVVDRFGDRILNIRVGGNDFCNLFGLRRSVQQTIYDLGVVRDILVDIVNMFSDGYVVSGPVWEYYGSSPDGAWAAGLRRELELDQANGFFGKTAIHPSQLPIIAQSLKAAPADVVDAGRIMNWTDAARGVQGSGDGGRMNELKCHGRWAERTLMRAQRWGVAGE